MYSQRLPTQAKIKYQIFVAVLFLEEIETITRITSSKYSAPTFAQGKPNGKLGVFIDLTRNTHIFKHDYTGKILSSFTTIADATQHISGTEYCFCKLDL